MQNQKAKASKTSSFVPLELHMNNDRKDNRNHCQGTECSSIFGRNVSVLQLQKKDSLSQENLDCSTSLYKPCLWIRVNKNWPEIISLLNKTFTFLSGLRPFLQVKNILTFDKVWLEAHMKDHVENQKKCMHLLKLVNLNYTASVALNNQI